MSATATPQSRVRRAARTVPVVRFTVKGQVRTDDDASPARAPAYGSPARAYTVVYDGACRICQGLVRRLGKWDRRGMLEIVPSQALGVHARFPWIPTSAYAQSVQLIRRDGHTWQGAAALQDASRVGPNG